MEFNKIKIMDDSSYVTTIQLSIDGGMAQIKSHPTSAFSAPGCRRCGKEIDWE
jgi:hypothetical protein